MGVDEDPGGCALACLASVADKKVSFGALTVFPSLDVHISSVYKVTRFGIKEYADWDRISVAKEAVSRDIARLGESGKMCRKLASGVARFFFDGFGEGQNVWRMVLNNVRVSVKAAVGWRIRGGLRCVLVRIRHFFRVSAE
jgi:hypothetical protein